MDEGKRSNYLIVDKRVLPGYYEKVVKASELLRRGLAKDVSEAVRQVGISRSTYYKYKDAVFAPGENALCKRAVVSFMLEHEPGMLGEILQLLAEEGANILTINQTLPIHEQANIVITLDMSAMRASVETLLSRIGEKPGASMVRLIAIE